MGKPVRRAGSARNPATLDGAGHSRDLPAEKIFSVLVEDEKPPWGLLELLPRPIQIALANLVSYYLHHRCQSHSSPGMGLHFGLVIGRALGEIGDLVARPCPNQH